jgi:hypothetical protein
MKNGKYLSVDRFSRRQRDCLLIYDMAVAKSRHTGYIGNLDGD